MELVRVVQDSEVIKVLADPVRREILRYLSVEPLTESQLAQRLVLKKSSVAHHLRVLREYGLIKIGKTRVGKYGIQEKFYEPTAVLFIEDWGRIPHDYRRYFLNRYLERVRGMLGVLKLLAERKGKELKVDVGLVSKLAHEVAEEMTRVGEEFEGREVGGDREELITSIYAEAFRRVIFSGRWKELQSIFAYL